MNGAVKNNFKVGLGIQQTSIRDMIRLFDKNIRNHAKEIYKKIGYIPKSKKSDQTFPATVKERIQLGSVGGKVFDEKFFF